MSKINDIIIKIITANYFVVKKTIKKYIKIINNQTILDLGCGTGAVASLFNPKKYLGLDIDKNFIKTAKELYPKYKFMEGDATDFKLNRKFDYIIIIGVLHHLNDSQVKKTLKLAGKHLERNGKILAIEAIPPINKLNFVGFFLRKMDKGNYVRKLEEYEKLIKNLKLLDSYEKRGGIVDYGVLYISN